MNSLSMRVEQYLELRRQLGTGLSASAVQTLRTFAAFAETQGAATVTTELFLCWKANYGSAGQLSWSYRLSHIRTFTEWLQHWEPGTEVPPRGLIPARQHRPPPYIYTDEQLEAIVTAAARLKSQSGLRAATYSTLFGLLAVTGLRISEALALDDCDVDTDTGLIQIQPTKSSHNRTLPLTPCTVSRLADYRTCRNQVVGASTDTSAFFVNEMRRRVSIQAAEDNFAQIGQKIGLRRPEKSTRRGRGPRLHDMRHTLATRVIIEWYRSGFDVDREMYKLSAWLGHKNPKGTYWYLEAVPELLQLAVKQTAGQFAREGDR